MSPRLGSLAVPLWLIGREPRPTSIREMDMPAVTDVSMLPSCADGTATPLAAFISSLSR